MPDNQSADRSRRTALLIAGLVLLFVAGYFFFRDGDDATSAPDSPVTAVPPWPDSQNRSESVDDVSQTAVHEGGSAVPEAVTLEPDGGEDSNPGTSQNDTVMDAEAGAAAVIGAGAEDAADTDVGGVNGIATGKLQDESPAPMGAESGNQAASGNPAASARQKPQDLQRGGGQADHARPQDISGSAPETVNDSSAETADINSQDSQSAVSPTGGKADQGVARSSPEGGQMTPHDDSSASLHGIRDSELFGMVDDLERKFVLPNRDDGGGARQEEPPHTPGSGGGDSASDPQLPLNGSGQAIVRHLEVDPDVLSATRKEEQAMRAGTQQADSGVGLSDDTQVNPQVSRRSVGDSDPISELGSASDDLGVTIFSGPEVGVAAAPEGQADSGSDGRPDDVRPKTGGVADDRNMFPNSSDSSVAASAVGSPAGDNARGDPDGEAPRGHLPGDPAQSSLPDSAAAEAKGGRREDISPQTSMLAEPDRGRPETSSTASAAETVSPVTAPEFDTVRIDKFGIALIAGRAEPETRIQAVVNNEVMHEQSVSRRGDFAMIFEVDPSSPALEITLRSLTDDGKTIPSKQSVVVLQSDLQPVGAAEFETADSVPSEAPGASAGGIQPLRPAVLLSSAGAVTLIQQTFPVLDSQTLVEMIYYDESGEAVLGGRASGLTGLVRIYVDNVHVKDAEIEADKSWSASLKEILPGRYLLRVDEVSLKGHVVGRVEMPLQKEDVKFVKAMLAAAAESVSPDSGVDAVPMPQLVTVQRGYTLWGISRSRFGLGRLYVNIFDLNKDQIRDPDLIYPGQIFKIPQADNLYDPEYDRIYVPRSSSAQRN